MPEVPIWVPFDSRHSNGIISFAEVTIECPANRECQSGWGGYHVRAVRFMITPHPSSRLARLFEHSVLTTDVARALRSSAAFTAAWVVCLWAGHPAVAVFAATAAQNLTLQDLRGDYGARLALLLTMTVVLAASVFAGTLTGNNIWSATLMVGALALLGSAWRHLSADYGPNLAIISALLFLFALSQPGDWRAGMLVAGWVSLGCAGGILIQLCGWFIRPQHPVRHAVAESWVAASDLIAAMRTETNAPRTSPEPLAGKESAVRATVDRTLHTIATATTQRRLDFFQHLDDATQIAARLATRVSAFHTALEPIRTYSCFTPLEPSIDLLLNALANAARSTALTLITHRPEQLMALDVRLRLCGHLIHILEGRLASLSASRTEVAQARQMLAQIYDLLPAIKSTITETVDHGSAHANFALHLPELGGLSLRSLSSWLNPAPELDPMLIRYALRVAVLTMIAVGIYQWFHVPRGYWIAFTAIIVLQPDYGSTRQKAGQRILGTLAGCALGSSLLWVQLPVAVLISLTAVMAFCFAYFLKRRYGLAIFFVTLMLVLITDAVEPLHWEFTLARLLSTLAGGAMALFAALLFWPKWEQEQFPKFLAAGVRANRRYLDAIAAALTKGEPFAGAVVQRKREAERANSLTAASLQRMLGEPSKLPNRAERAAALTAYNQRLTRAAIVLAVHLNQRVPFQPPEFITLTQAIGVALENLAGEIESGKTLTNQLPNSLATPPNRRDPAAELIYGQLARIATEIEAIVLAGTARSPFAPGTPAFEWRPGG